MMTNINVSSLPYGESGAGKTTFGISHPKIYMISTERDNEMIWNRHPLYRDNVVVHKQFMPDPANEELSLKVAYDPILANSTIVKCINEAKQMQKEGKIETLMIDNLTYLAMNKKMRIDKYEQQFSKQGNLNTEAMWGALGLWLYELFALHVTTFHGNLVVTAHQMREGEEAMEKKIDKGTDVFPDCLGSFRNKVLGMFSNIFYLQTVQDKEGDKYYARTSKANGVFAKNRFGLPRVIQNPSYQIIKTEIDKAMQTKEGK
jgi:hypothetical protein